MVSDTTGALMAAVPGACSARQRKLSPAARVPVKEKIVLLVGGGAGRRATGRQSSQGVGMLDRGAGADDGAAGVGRIADLHPARQAGDRQVSGLALKLNTVLAAAGWRTCRAEHGGRADGAVALLPMVLKAAFGAGGC